VQFLHLQLIAKIKKSRTNSFCLAHPAGALYLNQIAIKPIFNIAQLTKLAPFSGFFSSLKGLYSLTQKHFYILKLCYLQLYISTFRLYIETIMRFCNNNFYFYIYSNLCSYHSTINYCIPSSTKINLHI